MSDHLFKFTKRTVTISFDLSDTTQLSSEDVASAFQRSFDEAIGGYAYQTINKVVLDVLDNGNSITNQAVKCKVTVTDHS